MPLAKTVVLWLLFLLLIKTCTVFSCQYQRSIFGDKHVAALILARGGSKGIPLKNLAKIRNKPLIRRTLDVVRQINFTSIWTSTDSLEILQEIGDEFNVHWRASASASDDAPSILGVHDFLRYHPEIDVLALIQCTSPFIRIAYLKQALFLVTQQSRECVFAVTRSFKLRWLEDGIGTIKPLNFGLNKRPRRQDWSGELVETGMFYFVDRKLIRRGFLQSKRCAVVEVPTYESLEIDNQLDLDVANVIVELLG